MELFLPESGLMIWMLIGFLIVLFILAKVGWPMIMGAVTKRNQHISDSLVAAKEANEALAGIEAAKEKALAESQAEQIRMINESQELKKQLIEEAKAEARNEAEKIVADARLKIQKEQDEAMAQIKAEVITLSVDIAEKLLQRELSDKEAQSRYIEEILKEEQPRIEA
ncbi:MAG: F0F1 ATP synthase subunit B [Bacteroidales bacterium]|jgi:F-type H+-transporting ATPase subunit b|nr:F0F1 ATP synthase subunit B [Bacteroidales bacterium]MBQ5959015.1 F0F1 ATP synthase subunit B [Bacteroidales bacterium]